MQHKLGPVESLETRLLQPRSSIWKNLHQRASLHRSSQRSLESASHRVEQRREFQAESEVEKKFHARKGHYLCSSAIHTLPVLLPPFKVLSNISEISPSPFHIKHRISSSYFCRLESALFQEYHYYGCHHGAQGCKICCEIHGVNRQFGCGGFCKVQ